MPPPAQSAEARRSPRTNLFLTAALSSDGGSRSVRVRNISAGGALVEGTGLPAAGTNVRLRRGRLVIDAQLVWCDGGRAGLRFDSAAVVSDWLPGAQCGEAQAQLDEILDQLRAERLATGNWRSSPPLAQESAAPADPIDELLAIRTSLQQLANDLSADPALVAAHPEVQMLDVVVQKIAALAARLRSERPQA